MHAQHVNDFLLNRKNWEQDLSSEDKIERKRTEYKKTKRTKTQPQPNKEKRT